MKKLKDIQSGLEDYREAVKALGLEGEVKGDEFQALCVFHDDHAPSMFVNLTSGKFHCFSCGEGGPFKKLREHLGATDVVVDKNIRIIQKAEEQGSTVLLDKVRSRLTRYRTVVKDDGSAYLTKTRVKTLEYCKFRGLTEATALRFGLCDGKGQYAGRMVIPIRDVDGTLLSIAARHFTDNSQRNKMRKLPGGKAKDTLFGLYELMQGAKPDRLILVEGEIDAMSGQQCGYPTVGLGSMDATERQLRLMMGYKVDVCLDKGVRGDMVAKLLEKVGRLTHVRPLYLKTYKDLNEALTKGGEEAVKWELQ